jgi:hypothetical protein
MSVALVQTSFSPNNNAGGNSITWDFPANVQLGSLVLLAIQFASASFTNLAPSTISDTQGNTYTIVSSSLAQEFTDATWIQAGVYFAWAFTSAAGTLSVTANITGSGGYMLMEMYELSGANTTTPIDSAGTATTNGTTSSAPTAGPVTTSQPGEFGVVNFFNANGGPGNFNPGTGWTLDCASGGGSTASWWQYQALASASSVSGVVTGSADNYCLSMVWVQPPSILHPSLMQFGVGF